MLDKLEQYIVDNKQQLDACLPNEHVWERIDKQVRPTKPVLSVKSKRRRVYLPWAAAFTLFIGSQFMFGGWSGVMSSEEGADEPRTEVATTEGATKELDQIQSYYVNVINEQKVRLEEFKSNGLELESGSTVDIDRLQTDYQNLKEEFAYGKNREALIDAMLKNLDLQMNVLRQQVRILEKIKSKKDAQSTEI